MEKLLQTSNSQTGESYHETTRLPAPPLDTLLTLTRTPPQLLALIDFKLIRDAQTPCTRLGTPHPPISTSSSSCTATRTASASYVTRLSSPSRPATSMQPSQPALRPSHTTPRRTTANFWSPSPSLGIAGSPWRSSAPPDAASSPARSYWCAGYASRSAIRVLLLLLILDVLKW